MDQRNSKKLREDLSTFGGCKKLSGKKTGFFHVEEINDRWWMIDPNLLFHITHLLTT